MGGSEGGGNHWYERRNSDETAQIILAGHIQRLYAFYIDLLVSWILVVLILALLALKFSLFDTLFLVAHPVVAILATLFLPFFWSVLQDISFMNGSIGKHFMGICIVDKSGGKVSLSGAIIRNFVRTAFTFPFFLPIFVSLFTERRQGVHDLVAGTFVVERRHIGFFSGAFRLVGMLIIFFSACFGAYTVHQDKFLGLKAQVANFVLNSAKNRLAGGDNLSGADSILRMANRLQVQVNQNTQLSQASATANNEIVDIASPADLAKAILLCDGRSAQVGGYHCKIAAQEIMKTDRTRAFKMLYRSCELGLDSGCLLLGRLYRRAGQEKYANQILYMMCQSAKKPITFCQNMDRSAAKDVANTKMDEFLWRHRPQQL